MIGNGVSHKAGICATVDENISMGECTKTTNTITANIGLPRAGEIFTSRLIKGQEFWTLTPAPEQQSVRWVRVDGY